jgi:hypothetical protein
MTSTGTTQPSPIALPADRDLPPEVQALIARLSEPFPIAELRVRPGQVRRDGSAAQVLPYAEWWGSYQPRLDAVLGRANWRIRLIPWGTDSIIARMTVFGGLIERDSTGSSKESFDGGQDAEAQAMKRVCARTVGLGLYLYHLPEIWGRGERAGSRFFFADGEEERCLYELYRRAGLSTTSQMGVTLAPVTAAPPVAAQRTTATPTPAPTARAQSMNGHSASTSERLATARAALAQAEQQTTVGGPRRRTVAVTATPSRAQSASGASERQRAAIARLIAQVLRDGQPPATVNRIGQDQAGLPSLSGVRTPDALPRTLSSTQASALISALQGLLS